MGFAFIRAILFKFIAVAAVFIGLIGETAAYATPFTMSVPGTALQLPAGYPAAGGVAIVMVGVNGNAYYQFSNPTGAYQGYSNSGNPAAFSGNPFTINNPIALNCGFSSCATYFGGAIANVYIRFTANDGDTGAGEFDNNDITLRLNGYDVANWSTIATEITNNAGTTSLGFRTGFGNNTLNTGWFTSSNPALLSNILTTGRTTSQVYDRDPNDNYWDFRIGTTLTNTAITTVAPGYTLTKTSNQPTFTAVGQVISYTYVVTNIGSVPIRQLAVSDDKIGVISCAVTTILSVNPGQTPNSSTCTANYTVTQADFDAQKVTNIAKAIGVPDYGTLGERTATVTVTGPTLNPSIDVTKSSTLTSFGAVGSIVPYTFRVQNTGDATLTNVAVTDPRIPALACTAATLAPAAVLNCTANYTVTQADVDAFAISGTRLVNTASVTSRDPSGTARTDTGAMSLPGPVAAPAMTMSKVVQAASFDTVGAIIPYRITVRNTGNVTWSAAPAVTDPLAAVTCPVGPVAPLASVVCLANYTVTQANIDAGKIDNTANATITVGGVTATANASATINATRRTTLSLDKRLSLTSATSYAAVADPLTYSYDLTNTGNVTLNTVAATDDKVSVTCPATTLAPGATMTCTSATYSTTQADLNAGSVVNTANVTARAAGTNAVVTSNTDSATVPAVQTPALTITKTAPTVTAPQFTVGRVVTYSYSVLNSGNVQISAANQITITDDKAGVFNCGSGTFDPGATRTCTRTYTLTSADVIAGLVTNSAVARAGSVATSNQAQATIAPAFNPSISLVKTADLANVDATSDTITYSFTITNNGDTQIIKSAQPITVNDPMVGAVNCATPQPAVLNPTESFVCTATYTPTQAQLDAGSIVNNATAQFPYTNGGITTVLRTPSATATVPVIETPVLNLTKSGPAQFNTVGQVITFTFDAQNAGNVTLTNVVVTDPNIPALSCTFATIAPAATRSCTGNYTVTQADVDAGSVVNSANAQGRTAQGGTASDSAGATVLINPAFAVKTATLTKTANRASFTAVGDTIVYTMRVANTGTQTLQNITVTDALRPSYTCAIPVLAPGATNSLCQMTYAVTQADVDAGSVVNNASAASADFPTQTSTLTVTGPARVANYTLVKSASGSYSTAGNQVGFTFTVRNTGNTTLSSIAITDSFFTPTLTCTIATLAPGASDATCTANYTVTQADVDAGSVTNTATSTATGPSGVIAPAPKSSTVVVSGPTSAPAVLITKTATDGVYTGLGDTEGFTFAVQNIGNVTLSNLRVRDPALGFDCILANLAPNQIATSCASLSPLTATKTITQADIDAGAYTNTANVTGQSLVGGVAVVDEAQVTITGPVHAPALGLVKDSTAVPFTAVGENVAYTYVVTNTGNITLTAPITISDDKLSGVLCAATPAAGLAPNASLTCTGTYRVTQADLDAGSVTNIATASMSQPVVPANPGDPSIATVTSAAAQKTVNAGQLPALSIDKHVKSTSTASYGAVGDKVVFEYVVRNTGNVTTTSAISISDDKIPGSLVCAPIGLAPGASATCEQEWTADQAALDAGEVTNTAFATMTFGGSPITSATDAATVTAVQLPSLGIVKSFVSTTAPGFFNLNDTLTYSIVVTNTGNVTIDAPIALTDSLTAPVCPAVPGNKLAPNATLTCSATHVVTNNDLALGAATNVVFATGAFNGQPVQSPSDDAIYPVAASPALSLVKQATSGANFATLGQLISYDYIVDNTGNVGLSDDIYITDDKLGAPRLCRPASLGVFGTADTPFTCSFTYPVTQADLDLGLVTNNATANTIFAPSGSSTNVVSPNATATVTADTQPALTVAKIVSAGPNPALVGDVLTYQITTTNSGNQTISGVTVADARVVGLSCTVGGLTAPANVVLAPTEAMVCTANYTVTQADIDAQDLTNTADARGSDPQGQTTTGSDSNQHPVAAAAPAVTITKAITPPPGPDAAFSTLGQPVTFVVTVQNTGNVTLNTTQVTDDMVAGTCNVGSLAPGESDSSCNFVYTVTQADIDRLNGTAPNLYGGFTNTASGVSQPANPAAPTITGNGSVFAKGPDHEPAFGLVKDALTTSFAAVGDVISYSYTVANIGNVTLTAQPSVTDDKIGTFACGTMPVGGLLPGHFVNCTANYPVTQADVDAGFVTNIATTASSQTAASAPATETVNGTRTPGIALTKTPSIASNAAVGDVITYTYTAENTGNTTLTAVTVSDQHTSVAGTVALTIGGDTLTNDAGQLLNSTDASVNGVWDLLAPGDVATFTAAYTVTQADVDAGTALSNTASVSTTSPPGTTAPTDQLTVSVPVAAAAPALEVIKLVNTTALSAPPAVGEALPYTITVENTGNVTLTSIAVTDRLVRADGTVLSLASGPTKTTGDGGIVGAMEVGEIWTYVASYTLTQADVDAGGVSNQATFTARTPLGALVSDQSDDGIAGGTNDPTATQIASNAAIAGEKTIAAGPTAVGGVVAFSITATNTGNVTLNSVGIASDTLTRADGTSLTLTSGPTFAGASAGSGLGILKPGETATYTASYTLVQADIDAGGIANTATVTGRAPNAGLVTDVTDNGNDADGNTTNDPTTLTVPATPSLALIKRLATGSGPTFATVGQVLNFEFEVTNTGNVTLTNQVTISDPLITNAGGSVACAAPPIAPGAMVLCTGAYAVTQADIDAGSVSNTATASVGPVISPVATRLVPARQLPALTTVKTAAVILPSDFVTGAVINYNYLITNTGNTTITAPISVTDNRIAASAILCPALPVGGLPPTQAITCTASYTVTATDVDLGTVTNLATSTDGTTISPQVTETIPEASAPALSIVKSAAAGATFAEVGDTVGYTYIVTNSGTRAFAAAVTVEDDQLGSIACFAPTLADPDLRAGERVTCTATHTVTQTDLDAGQVVNQAYAKTSYGAGSVEVVSGSTSVTVPATVAPGITLAKTSTPNPVTSVGQIITYNLVAENTGNQTLTNVEVTDPMLPGLVCSTANLLRGQQLVCSDTYVVTQADVDRGTITNTATGSAITPAGGSVGATATEVTNMPTPAPALLLEKSALPSPYGAVGTNLSYLLAVTNTGNVTMTNLVVTDPLDPAYSCTIATLAPGARDTSCSLTIAVTQAQIDAGSIVNTAGVTGLDPFNTVATDTDTITTQGPARVPGIEATKLVLPSASTLGSNVNYRLIVRNTGNVSLTVAAPVDVMTRLDTTNTALDVPFALASGDSDSDNLLDVTETWIYAGQHTLTQADLDAGGLSNSATVSATGPNGAAVSDVSDNGNDTDGNSTDDPTVFEIVVVPQLTLTKTVSGQTGSSAGDTVTFLLSALNTGNSTLTNIQISDTLTRGDGQQSALTPTQTMGTTTLLPGQEAQWTVSYTLTQTDIDAGGISNTAVVTGDAPNGSTVTDVSSNGNGTDGNLVDDPTLLTIQPAPKLEVVKTLTSIGSAAGQEAVFNITVANTGNVTLTNVALTDTMTRVGGTSVSPTIISFVSANGSPASAQGTLKVGETATYEVRYVLVQADIDAGGLSNIATATASTPLGGTASDQSDDDGSGENDPTSALISRAPAVSLVKSAGAPQMLFPTVERVTFTLNLTNTGNTSQTAIQMTDDLTAFLAPATLRPDYPVVSRVTGFTTGTANVGYDGISDTTLLSGNATLLPGQTGTVEIDVVYSTALGQPGGTNVGRVSTAELTAAVLSNPVTVTSPDTDGDGVPDALEPAGDRDGDGIADANDYDPTGAFYCEGDGRLMTGGQVSVTGPLGTQSGIGTSNNITIVRDGSDGRFQFYVTAAGSYTLNLTYPLGSIASTTHLSSGNLDATSLLPANPASLGSNEDGSTGRLADSTPAGNRYYTTFTVEAGDPHIINNNIPVTMCAATPDLLATKTADRSTAVLGDTINYTVAITNNTAITYPGASVVDMLPAGLLYTPGSARVNGTAAEPVILGNQLSWGPRNLAPGGVITVTLAARVTAGGATGDLNNRTWLQDAFGAVRSNIATATVRRTPEAVFDCSDVIGKVFDDKNLNGYQDGVDPRGVTDDDTYDSKLGKLGHPKQTLIPEPGIPGVRLATVNGLLITTDEHGRFNVPCAALPRDTGSNFTLKLDPRSLPSGYALTTENPRVLRLTAGKVAKMNFGVALSNVVDVDLTASAFIKGEDRANSALGDAIIALVDQIKSKPAVLRLTYLLKPGETHSLATARLAATEKLVRKAWRWTGQYQLEIEKSIKRVQ